MEQPKQNIKLVSNKNSRVILPNILTLFGVCIGLSSIKFAFDGNFELAVIALIVAGIIDGLDANFLSILIYAPFEFCRPQNLCCQTMNLANWRQLLLL